MGLTSRVLIKVVHGGILLNVTFPENCVTSSRRGVDQDDLYLVTINSLDRAIQCIDLRLRFDLSLIDALRPFDLLRQPPNVDDGTQRQFQLPDPVQHRFGRDNRRG